MNDKKHWDNIAENYDSEILNVFQANRDRKLASFLQRHGGKRKVAIDFGCGIGNGFPHLAPLFKEVLALDISPNCLEVAKQKDYRNIKFGQMDLTKPDIKVPVVDFVLCSNVALFPDVEKNYQVIRNVKASLRPGGNALFVVPSLESMLFYGWRLIDWYRREGVEAEKIDRTELNYYEVSKTDLLQGIIKIDDHPTKHYTEAELQVIFPTAGLKVTAIERLEYDWSTEFKSPPQWMKAPYPWDWLVESCNDS